jgi:hypothetical protein
MGRLGARAAEICRIVVPAPSTVALMTRHQIIFGGANGKPAEQALALPIESS